MWGVSDKVETYLRAKKAAKERAEGSNGGGGGAWGVWGGSKTGRKGEGGAATNLEDRRKEEADRIRGHLDRVLGPSQWRTVSAAAAAVSCCGESSCRLSTALRVKATDFFFFFCQQRRHGTPSS